MFCSISGFQLEQGYAGFGVVPLPENFMPETPGQADPKMENHAKRCLTLHQKGALAKDGLAWTAE